MPYSFTLRGDRYVSKTVNGSARIKFHNLTKDYFVGMYSPDDPGGHWPMLLGDYPQDLLDDLAIIGMHISIARLTLRAAEGNLGSLALLQTMPEPPPLPESCITCFDPNREASGYVAVRHEMVDGKPSCVLELRGKFDMPSEEDRRN